VCLQLVVAVEAGECFQILVQADDRYTVLLAEVNIYELAIYRDF
jgi:hypothetical protein